MLDPAQLYRIEDDAPPGPVPVLVHHLAGYLDAGHAGRLASDQLMSGLTTRRIATFDVDQLIDYRGRRPGMTFDRDRWADYAEPTLALHAAADLSGTPFLLLTGPEPDSQWNRFTAAVIELVERFGVELTVGLGAIPMAVPHTRPVGITAHATRRELITDYEPWSTTATLPGSASALLELRLGQLGHDALGLAAHVPHYLAETDYPRAAQALLEHLTARTGLTAPTEALAEAASKVAATVEERVAASEQAAKVVRALERRYDDAESSGAGPQPPPLLAEDQQVPSGDELGAEIERFLAEQG